MAGSHFRWQRRHTWALGGGVLAWTASLWLAPPAGAVGRWAACALVVMGLADALRVPARVRRGMGCPPCPAWLAFAVIAVASWVVSPSLWSLDVVAGWDNPVHLWHTQLLADGLPFLRGWSSSQGFGMGHGEDYALAVYLPAALLHRVTLRALSVDACMSLEVLASALLLPMGLWAWLGQRVGRWPALVGAVAVMFDGGWFHQVGTVPLLVIGLWPFRWSLAFCVLALWAGTRMLERPSLRWAAACAVCAFVAVQSHIAGLTYLGFGVLVQLCAWRWRRDDVPAAAALGAIFVGAALSAGWVVLPWLALRDAFLDVSAGEAQYPSLWERVVALHLLERNHPLEMLLQVAGVAWWWRRDRFSARLVIAAWVLGFFILTRDMVPALLPTSMKLIAEGLQYPRQESWARVLSVMAGGAALGMAACFAARRWTRLPRSAWTAVSRATVVGALVAAAAVARSPAYERSALKTTRGIVTLPMLPSVRGVRQAVAALQVAELPKDALVVVDHVQHMNGPLHLGAEAARCSTLAVVQSRRMGGISWPVYTRNEFFTAAELVGGGATHWISVLRGMPVPGATLLGSYEGGVTLWALKRQADDQRVVGHGVRVVTWEEGLLAVDGPPDGFAATLRVRATPGWEVAEGDGVVLDRGPLFPGSPAGFFLRVNAPPGVSRVVLKRDGPPAAAAGFVVTAVGIALMAAGLARLRRPQKTEFR